MGQQRQETTRSGRRGRRGSPLLHHPFPHPASVPGVPGSQAGLLSVAAATSVAAGGAGVGAGQGPMSAQGQQGYGSFGALGPPVQAGLTPHLTGTSSVAGSGAPPGPGPGAGLSADRERERNSGSPFPVAASPLAGALTGAGAGSIPNALPVPSVGSGLEARRDSAVSRTGATTSPYMSHPPAPGDGTLTGAGGRKEGHTHSFSTASASASGSNSNPLLYPTQSRGRDNASSTSPRFSTPPAPTSVPGEAPASLGHAHTGSTSGRAAPPGNLGPLPPNYFAALTGSGGKVAPSQGATAGGGGAGMPAAPHFPVPIEGMAHQGVGLGPPGNLHDRVVFVSNVSPPPYYAV